jgi:hypothetical protein
MRAGLVEMLITLLEVAGAAVVLREVVLAQEQQAVLQVLTAGPVVAAVVAQVALVLHRALHSQVRVEMAACHIPVQQVEQVERRQEPQATQAQMAQAAVVGVVSTLPTA